MHSNNYLVHYGVKGMSWGRRRWQNVDGTLTDAGKRRYGQRLEVGSIQVPYTNTTRYYKGFNPETARNTKYYIDQGYRTVPTLGNIPLDPKSDRVASPFAYDRNSRYILQDQKDATEANRLGIDVVTGEHRRNYDDSPFDSSYDKTYATMSTKDVYKLRTTRMQRMKDSFNNAKFKASNTYKKVVNEYKKTKNKTIKSLSSSFEKAKSKFSKWFGN